MWVSRTIIDRARKLRLGSPSPERLLWQVLKGLNRDGCHFRRQAPIGPYFVDFAWLSIGLVIEIDGDGHFTDDAMAADRRRDRFFTSQGLTVLRFSNSEVFTSAFDVGQRVLLVANDMRERRGRTQIPPRA